MEFPDSLQRSWRHRHPIAEPTREDSVRGSSSLWCSTACVIAYAFAGAPRIAEPTAAAKLGEVAPEIAYASDRDGNWEIYGMDPDGGRQSRLTRRAVQDRFPLWSPDRSQLAFGSQVGGDHWELWVVQVDGTNPRFLASQIAAKGHRQWSHADPSWSPDDRDVVFSSTREGNAEIYVMRADGTERRRLTNDAAPDGSPAWSPDGARIAFVSTRDGERDAYLLRVDDGRVERLTAGARATNDALRWSPSGEYLAMQTAARDNYDIQLVGITNHKRWTVAGTPAYDGQFSWSPTSDQLAFVSERDGVHGVYVTDLMGQSRRLTTTASLNPAWSP